MKRRKFEIVCSYDTETTNIVTHANGKTTARAFPVLFIDNCLLNVDLKNYEPGEDDIRFYRHEGEMMARIAEYIQIGQMDNRIPIVCAYNLMFDLQPLMELLNLAYDIRVNAQSSTNVYTLDLYELDTDNMLLRFWDTYHLEMRGLAAMGRTAGLPKAVGDWDYSLVRTPETPLTDEELFYAGRDTQVIPMYLRYLLKANEWLKQDDLGNRVITKTSIVRQMARREIGTIFVGKKDGKRLSLDKAFITRCIRQRPDDYGTYALRKACFRGGFTFTSAVTAGEVVHNVVSLDVTSMHHTFINGRLLSEDFSIANEVELKLICDRIIGTSLQHVLEHYERPFENAIHARIRFTNIRLRSGSVFEKMGIGLLSTSKFKHEKKPGNDVGLDPRAIDQENEVRSHNWHDFMEDGIVAFGKMYSAKSCVLNLSELELWCVSRVYEWDKMEPLCGEVTGKFRIPPDFVTLQSNELFEMKSRAKFICKHYRQGTPYPYNLSGVPDGIADALRDGTCDESFLESWYTGTVKGMFNGIYGTQAQDTLKPSYTCVNGELVVDDATRTTPENYVDKTEKQTTLRVLYTYGLRIVGGSRMHMVISMELLASALGDRIRILGGDTDSMKVSCDYSVSDDMLDDALRPIAEASEEAIRRTMRRVRATYPDRASSLCGIGGFDIENRGHHYTHHVELWNKCRVSWDGKAHVTAAGLPRPVDKMNIEKVIDLLAKKYSIEYVLKNTLGYNTYVTNSISHTLEGFQPRATDMYDSDVTDYTGATRHVTAHQSKALYETGRLLGDTDKATNGSSVAYLYDSYGRSMSDAYRYIRYDGGKITVSVDSDDGGTHVIMEVEA